MRALRQSFVFFCLGAVVLLAVPPALAQKSVAPPEEVFSKAQPKDPYTRAKLRTELGALYFQSGEIIFALEELTTAISIDPNYAPAYSIRGLALYFIKELASAEKDFKKALDLDAKDPEINNNYGWFLCQTGREKESIAFFELAINNLLYRTPELAFLNAGTCYIKIGELGLAEDYIRKSLRFSPESPQGLFQLSSIYYKRGNFEAAKKHLADVVRLSDPNAEALWLMLRVERRLGDRQAESSFAAQLRRKYPDSPEYQELLKGNFE